MKTKCDYCPLSDPEYVCPEAEGKYGLVFKDRSLGCRHPKNWAEKRSDAHDASYGEMGLDMGIEMSMSKENFARAIEICKHMVGLDYSRPYHRHGKAFYKAYRNYYTDGPSGNAVLDRLPNIILEVCRDEHSTEYHLTDKGLAWLGRQLQITVTRRN